MYGTAPTHSPRNVRKEAVRSDLRAEVGGAEDSFFILVRIIS